MTDTLTKDAIGINDPKWNPKDNTKVKKTRTPRNNESIFKGALSLPLQERVDLKWQLDKSIAEEVETIKEAAKKAESIANGGQ
jgi:hypothetical protein